MNNFRLFTFLLLMCAFLVGPSSANAVMVVEKAPAAESAVVTQEMKKQEKKQKRFNKMVEKFQKKFEKRQAKIQEKLEKRAAKRAAKGKDVDFSDPVDKWLWYAVFGWGLAIVLSVVFSILTVSTGFYFGWGIVSLLGLFATVAFVLWLIKKFGDDI